MPVKLSQNFVHTLYPQDDRLKIMARTKPPSDKELKIRLPKNELELLEAYCTKHGKTKTEVLREWIRSLKLDS